MIVTIPVYMQFCWVEHPMPEESAWGVHAWSYHYERSPPGTSGTIPGSLVQDTEQA